jgi:PAS domain S-box-containing protein
MSIHSPTATALFGSARIKWPRRRFLFGAALFAQMTAMGAVTWIASYGHGQPAPAALAVALFVFGSLILALNRRRPSELTESEDRTQQIIDTSLDAVIMMDAQGVIVGWSAQAEPIFGWSAQEAIGRSLADTIIPPQYRKAHNEGMRRYLSSGHGPVLNKRIEISAARRDGEQFPIELAIAPLKCGGRMVFSAFLRDISQNKRAEAELRQAKEQAETANHAKSEFLANMSHEIRTPMNGVIGMTDLLLASELDERQRRYANMVKASAESLLGLINDILDFSKIEAGKLELSETPFDVGLAIEDAVEMFAQRAQQQGLDLCCHVDPLLRRRMVGDPDRLRQILINLLGNALKFTERGEVIVRAAVRQPSDGPHTEKEGVLVHFSVHDSGIGIPPERMDRLFKSFSQVDPSTTRQYGGTGLGLAICKQLTELMGGEIGVESEYGKGSTFWFTARLSQAPADVDAGALPRVQGDARGLRVLVVDRSDAHRQILKEQLESWGFNARGTPDGQSAMNDLLSCAAMGRPYGVVIVEQNPSDMDAKALAGRIKAEPSIRDTTLMLLCGMDQPDLPKAMAPYGYRNFISKPVRQSQLFDEIIGAIDRQALAVRPLESSEPAVKPSDHRGANILLADDHEINRMVAVEVLEQAGYRCRAVNDGQAAADAAAEGGFDLILMDCQMPRLDGFDATRLIRSRELSSPGSRRMPIIALTANALKGDKERCLEAGMDGYISKPLDPAKLMEAIEGALRNKDGAATVKDDKEQLTVNLPPSSPPQEPPIDLPSVLQRCGSNQAFVAKMLQKFADQSGESFEKLQSAVQEGDAAGVGQLAHGLKGTAAMLSAERVRALAAELEALAAADHLDVAERAVEHLRSEIEACADFIPRLIEQMAEK